MALGTFKRSDRCSRTQPSPIACSARGAGDSRQSEGKLVRSTALDQLESKSTRNVTYDASRPLDWICTSTSSAASEIVSEM